MKSEFIRPAKPLAMWRHWLERWHTGPAEPRVARVYQQMLTRIQRDMLIVIMTIGSSISIPFGLQIYQLTWIERVYSPWMLILHLIRLGIIIPAAVVCIRRKHIRLGWLLMMSISTGTTFVMMGLIRESGLLIFMLFSTAGGALVLPLRVNVGIIIAGVAGTALLAWVVVLPAPQWFVVSLVFAGIMAGLCCCGVVIRRLIKQWAVATIQIEDEAVRRTEAEQRVRDLRRQFRQIALLEHDLRQPLKVVQGNLLSLVVSPTDQAEIVAPTLAAAGRAERMVNNLLDHARREAQQQRLVPQRIDVHALFERIGSACVGLSRYYTDPPIPIQIELDPAPLFIIADPEQLERAILNLVDNALVRAPLDSRICIRVIKRATTILITVQDAGNGIPAAIITTMMSVAPQPEDVGIELGFGLVQVKTMVASHQGKLFFSTQPQGATIHLELPTNGAV